ncbi:organic cation/carnitine transporter 2-like [Amblyomma americanum]
MAVLMLRRLPSKDMLVSESFDCYDAFGHGKFQMRLMLLCSLGAFLANAHGLSFSMISRDVGYTCKLPSLFNDSAVTGNNASTSLEPGGQSNQCLAFEDPDDPDNTRRVSCQEWEYDEEWKKTTVVSEWDLVCQRKWLLLFMSLLQNVGATLFIPTVGPLADRVGRVPVLLASALVLAVCTAGGCLATTYRTLAVSLFLSSGSSALIMALSAISLFEVTAHSNRPLHIIVTATLGLVFSDFWYFSIIPANISWRLKNALFLLPPMLLIPLFYFMYESPRWLVAKGRFERAEAVMLAAAEMNYYPLPNAGFLLGKLQMHGPRNVNRRSTIIEDLLSAYSIRLRAVIIYGLFFSNTLASYVVSFSTSVQYKPRLPYVSFATNLACYALLHLLIRRLTMLTVITAWFAVLCLISFLLSLTVAVGQQVIVEALVFLETGFYYSGAVTSFVYAFELFPTALRATAVSCAFASARVGALCSCFALPLKVAGHEDVALAVAGCLLLATVISLRRLPPATAVECSKMASRRSSAAVRQMFIEHMKTSLEPRPEDLTSKD